MKGTKKILIFKLFNYYLHFSKLILFQELKIRVGFYKKSKIFDNLYDESIHININSSTHRKDIINL